MRFELGSSPVYVGCVYVHGESLTGSVKVYAHLDINATWDAQQGSAPEIEKAICVRGNKDGSGALPKLIDTGGTLNCQRFARYLTIRCS